MQLYDNVCFTDKFSGGGDIAVSITAIEKEFKEKVRADIRQRGKRQKIITNALSAFAVEDRGGEILLKIEEDQYGDALYSFVQTLLKISDVGYLSRERARSTFLEDSREFIEKNVPASRHKFDWHDTKHDPERKYIVDCHINSMPRPVPIYALTGDDKVRGTTMGLLQFERWELNFRAVGIFEDQEEVNRKVLARFSDVCEKQFSILTANFEQIHSYLEDAMRG